MDPQHTFLRVHARLSGMLEQLQSHGIRCPLGIAIVLLGVLTVMHVNLLQSTIMAGNQECQDPVLCGKDEGRQDDEMMQNHATSVNENRVQETLDKKDRVQEALDKKDEGRQDDEMMQNQATLNPNLAEKALDDKKDEKKQEDEMMQNPEKVNEKLPGSQTQWQTGQNQRGNSQTQTLTQTQTQTHTETSTETRTETETTQSKPA